MAQAVEKIVTSQIVAGAASGPAADTDVSPAGRSLSFEIKKIHYFICIHKIECIVLKDHAHT